MSDLDFGFLNGQWGFVLQGLLGTVRLALTSLVVGTLIGLLCAAAQISGSRALRAVGILRLSRDGLILLADRMAERHSTQTPPHYPDRNSRAYHRTPRGRSWRTR